MANLNKVMLIGRLTRDPEVRTFSNGGKVAKFGFAVNNRKKNQQTGQWEDDPVFLDVEAFNRGEFGKLADFLILSQDILTVPDEQIRSIQPLATYVGGRKVFSRKDGSF